MQESRDFASYFLVLSSNEILNKRHYLDFHPYDQYFKKKASFRTCALQTVQIILVNLRDLKMYNNFCRS